MCRSISTRPRAWAGKCSYLQLRFPRERLRGCRIPKETRSDSGKRSPSKGEKMKRPSNSLFAVACVVAFALPATSLLGGKHQKTDAKPILMEAKRSLSESDHVLSAETGKSAPEMERLKFYLGTWDYTETYPKSTFSPKGGQNPVVYTSQVGPGGN